jgi:hypothetical protein
VQFVPAGQQVSKLNPEPTHVLQWNPDGQQKPWMLAALQQSVP